MLLRDMTVRGTKRDLLDGANFLFVPIFTRRARALLALTRINQRGGPEEGGWRRTPATSTSIALHEGRHRRDARHDPHDRRGESDLYIDLHVTDGADYQYDVTYG